MKALKKSIAVIVIIATFMSSVVFAKAEDKGKFVSCSVVSYDENGEEILNKEPFYSDGKYLYADSSFFEDYTLYYYDKEKSAFVREGQKFELSLSNLKVDYENKKVTAKMMKSSKTYDLHDVIQYNNDYYLPIDQICSFLKARIEIRDDKLYIKNGGISIADAAYMFNNYKYIFGYTHIVGDIFANCTKAYYAYTIALRFGSTVFGLKLSNLDFLHDNGNVEVYSDILEESVSDMSEYIKSQQDENTFEKRVAMASDIVDGADSLISKSEKVCSVINDIGSFFDDDSESVDYGDYDTEEWGDILKKLTKVTDYAKYMLKMINMADDHKMMLEEYVGSLNQDLLDIFNPVFQAFYKTYIKFGVNFHVGIITKIGDELTGLVKKEATDAIPEVVPYLKVIKVVNAVFKVFGVELDDDSSYNVLLEGEIERILNERYESLYDDSGVSVQQSESFRRSAIFMLLTEKHGFESGNKLSKKVNKTEIFNDQLDNICAKLNLFYRAAESKNFDSFAAMELNCINNEKAIKNSKNILDEYQEEETNRKTKSNSWQEAAIEFLYNLPKYAKINKMMNDYLSIELIDMNQDNVPEIIFYSVSAGGGGKICRAHAVWTGEQYAIYYFDEKDSNVPTDTIIPYKDNDSNKTVFISGMFDKDYFYDSLETGRYASGSFWRGKWSQDVWQCKNNYLTLRESFKVNEVKDFDKLYNPSNHSVEERQEALDNVREYNRMLHSKYSEIEMLYCETSIKCNGIISNKYSMESYHDVMSKDKAEGFINAYLTGKHSYKD